MADEEQNNQEENEQVEETAEETVSAPEGPVAPAAETQEPAAEEPAAEEPAAEYVAEEAVAEEAPAGEAESAEEVETEAEAPAEAPQEVRRKRKRLPRAQRHRHSKPKRERPAERKAIARVPKPEHPRGRRQERRGVVISSGMDKTIVVRVDAVKAHPKYLKVVRRSTKFHAHDEENQAKVGDVVRIVETRPLSKTKNWRLAEIVEVAK
jgi:small subunit ribosomal protein S17